MLISSTSSGRIRSYASLIVTIMILDSVILSILHTHLCKLYMPLARLDLPVLLPYLFFPANVTQTAKLVKTTPEKWEVDLLHIGQTICNIKAQNLTTCKIIPHWLQQTFHVRMDQRNASLDSLLFLDGTCLLMNISLQQLYKQIRRVLCHTVFLWVLTYPAQTLYLVW